MNNPIVEFFGSYGPQPSSNNLYDEFVQQAAEKTGCKPIEIAQPLVGELAGCLQSDQAALDHPDRHRWRWQNVHRAKVAAGADRIWAILEQYAKAA